MSDAWRNDWVKANGPAYPLGNDEAILMAYCSKLGMEIIESTSREYLGIRPACAMCTCPTRVVYFLLVSERDAEVVAAFGGRRLRPDQFVVSD
jgi:hypothetical protein